MVFKCTYTKAKKTENWTGNIMFVKEFGSCYELRIESRSSITVIFGKTTYGGFACMPDFGAGCHLASLTDQFWNTEKLTGVLGTIDGITVASALYALSDKIKF